MDTEKKYLYGASVQGIQKFIFSTSKLKDIVGASLMVDLICSELFWRQLNDMSTDINHLGGYKNELDVDENCLISAAGNIKYICDEKTCRKIYRNFPKAVMEFAPGITISQASVELKDDISASLSDLEFNLKTQRNRRIADTEQGFIITRRDNRTGNPAVCIEKGEAIDKATQHKRTLSRKTDNEYNLYGKLLGRERFRDIGLLSSNSEEWIKGESNSYVAVIHIDGNSIGKIIPQLTNRNFKLFSRKLQEATEISIQSAFQNCYYEEDGKLKECYKKQIPFRPIVIGGDDVTVICDAKNALNFTKCYLAEFEKKTEHLLHDIIDKPDLTACAGIAFVKAKYPFYYAVDLAEDLCRSAKIDSKGINDSNPPSSLRFFKVESSFYQNFETIRREKLEAKESGGISFDNGSYLLHKSQEANMETISELENKVEIMKGENSPKSQIRNWLTILRENKEQSQLLLERVCEMLLLKDKGKVIIDELSLEDITENKIDKTDLYDVVTLASLMKE
ncbi:MAG: hypothetical protein RBT65_14355 [Methanolobus sp.]|nr:hypothetical protein [Methanolobus sp.]